MKKFLVLIFAVLLFNSTQGQTYHKLIKPHKFWDIQTCLTPPGFCDYTFGYRYYFKGDTVIAGKIYDVIYGYPIRSINPGPYCPPYAIDTNVTYQRGIFMREDTLVRKVFVYNNAINSDDLLYDFTLQPGDTLKSQYSYMPIVTKVSDTTLLTGDTMKVFYLNNGENYIESIGGSKGFCFPMFYLVNGCSHPKCIENNGVHIWGDACYPLLTSNVAHYEYDHKIEIFPNPATDFLELKRNDNSEITINIYDMTGRIILIKTLNNKSEKIDISLLKAGTYIYKLFGLDSQTIRGKIIKIE